MENTTQMVIASRATAGDTPLKLRELFVIKTDNVLHATFPKTRFFVREEVLNSGDSPKYSPVASFMLFRLFFLWALQLFAWNVYRLIDVSVAFL